MIIVSRCPYRISLLGGSSDLDWFVNKKGRGYSIGFAVSSYSRVIVGFRGGNSSRGLLNYSSREEYNSIDSITHPMIRESFKKLSVKKPIELASFGESFLGGGLASSSSFLVALVKSITELHNKNLSNSEVAELACEIELKLSNTNIGRQDQYLCALGGINFLKFEKKGIVKRNNYPLIAKAIAQYSQELYLINTSVFRSASKQLAKIKDDPESYKSIEEILLIAENFINDVKNISDIDLIMSTLDSYIKKSWEIKKNMKGVMNDQLFEIQEVLIKKGFKILKIIGAGGGGYFIAKYEGSDFSRDTKDLNKKNLFIKQVPIDYKGCQSWTI